MQIRAELCHVDTLRCIVRVEAWQDGDLQGSALGEAASAEDAEERAFQRLQARLQTSVNEWPGQTASRSQASESKPESQTNDHEQIQTETRSDIRPDRQHVPVERPKRIEQASSVPSEPLSANDMKGKHDAPSETPTDPEDWSDELTAIEMEIRRIGWGREQEQTYLMRAFGHGSRHKLTRYADLVAYLRQLKLIQANDDASNAPVPIRRGDLLSQGDLMLKQLGWSSDQARAFLQQHLGSTSRQQLSDEQLLQFNMLLEEQTLSETK